MPLFLAVVAFLAYWPSLKSDFVYDGRLEMIEEGFITSLANLPAVLTFKVLGMNLILGSRPGQLLFLMLNAAVWGKDPWGFHLSCNLLHAANVALLFVLLCRLIATEIAGLVAAEVLKARVAAGAVCLIFALHPISVETVAEVNYSSDLLVTFFTLLALLAATAFRPENLRLARLMGGAGAFCAFAAVTCKESGIAAALLLIAYWFIFRREENQGPWLRFLGSATAASGLFLAARFLFAPKSLDHLSYLGGSFSQVFLIQPRLWVFMMGKLVWPANLSADYTMTNLADLTTPTALVVLLIVVGLQAWLTVTSRLGALGVATYWLGLVTVSNFIPLNRILGDRFYYLPMAGVAMQVLALLLMTLRFRQAFWTVVAICLGALIPLTLLTVARQAVFADESSLWTETLRVSPDSSTAETGIGSVLLREGRVDDAIAHYRRALELTPNLYKAHYNLGNALLRNGQVDEAIVQYQKTLEISPAEAIVHYNLGAAFLQKGKVDAAIDEYQKALALEPNNADFHYNLGNLFLQKGMLDDALGQYQQAVAINPSHATAHGNLGIVLFKKGQVDNAIAELSEAVQLDPTNRDMQNDLAKVQAVARQMAGQLK